MLSSGKEITVSRFIGALCHSPKAPGCPLQAKPHLQQDSQTSVACHRLSALGPVFCLLRHNQAQSGSPSCADVALPGIRFEWMDYTTPASAPVPTSVQKHKQLGSCLTVWRKNSLTYRLMPAIPPLDSHSFNLNSEFSGVLCSGRGECSCYPFPPGGHMFIPMAAFQRQRSWPCLEHLSPGTEGIVAC